MAELACHVGNMVELPNQSQQNIGANLMGHPVVQYAKDESLIPDLRLTVMRLIRR